MKALLTLIAICISIINGYSQTNYSFYYGNLHAHTSYSDGNPDSTSSGITKPIQAFNYAKNSQHIDFYGISDHNHNGAGMYSKHLYHQGIADANTANVDGSFVAMYGVEWGVISSGGHILVYGTDSLMGWDNGVFDIYTPEGNYPHLWKKINQRPNTFAYLCHPNSTDFGNILNNTVNSSADSAIIGLAGRSGPAFSTNTSYSNPSSSDNITEFNMALARGYHLGIGLDHDTHNSIYGRQSKQRLVVMAPSLTRANIYDGLKKMRFYCSDDWNVQVKFQIQNQHMGSIITHSGVPTLSVSVVDLDGTETVSSIQIYHGIAGSGTAPTLLTSASNTANMVYTHTSATNNSNRYYYARITQGDGNKIWTSPIWYNRNDAYVETAPVADFTTTATKVCIDKPVLFSDKSLNAPFSWTWTATGASPSLSYNQYPNFTYSASGVYTITLQAFNNIGLSSITKTIEVLPTTVTPTITANSINMLSTSASAYQWYINNFLISSVTTQSINATSNGVFHVITTDVGYCPSAKSNTIQITNVSIDELIEKQHFQLYPNPNNGLFIIQFETINNDVEMSITNLSGQVIYNKHIECMDTNCEQKIDISNHSCGTYILKLTIGGTEFYKKLIIE